MRDAYSVADGVRVAADLALGRPPRLGQARLVAVDGPSGSGKTSLAGPLAQAIAEATDGIQITPTRDGSSYLGETKRDEARTVTVVSTDLLATWEHPLDWWPILSESLLAPIAAGSSASMPVVQWISGQPRPGGHIVVPPVDVLVLEGVSAGRRAVTDQVSALVWVEVPGAAIRLERAVARDGETMRPHLVQWQREEAAHFSADGTRARADIVIDPTAV